MYQKHKLQNIKNYTFVTFYFPVTTGVILTISFHIALLFFAHKKYLYWVSFNLT